MFVSRSLRAKLIAVLISTLLGGWLIWFGWQYHQLVEQRSGEWDQSLRGTAQYILQSMPSDVESVLSSSRLKLSENAEATPSGDASVRIEFQVWSLQRHQILLASPSAPHLPLITRFFDGPGTTIIDGKDWRVYAVSDAQGRVQVQVGARAAKFREDLSTRVRQSLTSAVLFLVGLSIAISWGVSWGLRPMHRLSRELTRRDVLNLTPLPLSGVPREIQPFVASFNGMLVRLEKAVESERQFHADVAHELRTPLAALLTQVRVARKTMGDEQSDAALNTMALGIERMSRLVQQLLDAARVNASRDRPEQSIIELAEVVTIVPHEFGTTAARRGQVISVSSDACAAVMGNLDDIGILLRNLLDNALRYGRDGGRVEVSCSNDRDSVILRVADDGPSVPEEERQDIFRRFYRGSGANRAQGSGIGLSLVSRIAQAHGASVSVGPGLGGRGLGITVIFRRVAELP